jgi:type III pantothenate kinase
MTLDRKPSQRWLALMIGNSRLHWALFEQDDLKLAWDMPHLSAEAIVTLIDHQLDFHTVSEQVADRQVPSDRHLPLWIASVVPKQTEWWQAYDRTQVVERDRIPISGLYPTLGIDRALALWGAMQQFGAPALVIDAGTALTFTGGDASHALVGGAIMPGLQVQLRSLAQQTAALPLLHSQNLSDLPPRWATSTPDAIYSGVLYAVLAGVKDFITAWRKQFPHSAIALTGGDGQFLFNCLTQIDAQIATSLILEPHLVLLGLRSIKCSAEQ